MKYNTLRDKIFSLRHEGEGLTGRIALAFIGVSFALAVLYGIGGSSVIYYLLKEHEAIATKSLVEIAAQKTETALITLSSTVESLSANTIFVNGLVDTYGRDSYLIPFLKSSRLPVDVPHRLSLCNFKGDVIASSETSAGSYSGETALVKELMTFARPVVSLLESGKKILICYPVIYPAVGTAEGFLALEFLIKDLMVKLEISQDASISGFQLFSATKQVWQIGAAEGTGHARQLSFSNQLASLKLSLQVWTPGNPALIWFVVIFIFIMLLSLYIAVKMAFRVSGRLTSRLVVLDHAAADMAASGTPQGEVDAKGTDEIARLGASFNSMIRRLKDSYQLLESRVEERTGQLRKANSELEAENALRRELVLMLESVPNSIVVHDAEGNFLYANQNTFDLHGYSRDEFMALNLRRITSPFDEKQVATRLQELMRRGAISFEVEHIKQNGTMLPLLVKAKKATWRGESVFLSVQTDITERKRAEEEKRSLEERLQRSEKMEALGQLAGGVAHDLNNVLGILSGYSELLLDEIPEGSPSRGHVEKILTSTKKGAAIIEDLLTLARRGVKTSDVININQIISDFLQTPVFEKLKDHHSRVTFRTEYDANLPNIKGSPVHLEKALMNLVSNAAEAITEAGEVTIRTENRYLDEPIRGYDEIKSGDYAVLILSDTGMGIPDESIKRVFEPFYTKKTMGKSGTGLGLAIVWGTVKDHSGYIDLRSELGRGTTFTLYFPVTRDEVIAPHQGEPHEQYQGNGESVLVVDDIAEQREIASSLLTKLGYVVNMAASGEEACEYLRNNRADILVLDMIMKPGIDGLETYRRILEINPDQKAILVSGFSETDRVGKAQKLGAGAYVKKPYLKEKIGVAIRDELAKK